ncbi:MAG: LysR family transcriptional regulator [Stellaceae bacterium]
MARLTLRLDFGPGRAIGHGKIRLLEAVRDYGSISAAGRSMGMSYRRAWLLIDELNHIFEEPVIDAKHGGFGGGGAELTRFGHCVVQRYRSIEAKAAADLDALAAATLKSPLDC